MGDTKIEWAEKVWNPATGCTKVSAGCANCYAEAQTERFPKSFPNGFKYTEKWNKIDEPRRWKKPAKIFVNSMSDFFHEDADPEFQSACLKTMMECPRHTFQILTKRPRAAAEFLNEWYESFCLEDTDHPTRVVPNIWVGTSVECGNQADRILELIKVPAQVRFISFEPLIGPFDHYLADLYENIGEHIHWAIIGGESGPKHRPCKREWVTELICDLREEDIPVFFKQWGGRYPTEGGDLVDGVRIHEWPEGTG